MIIIIIIILQNPNYITNTALERTAEENCRGVKKGLTSYRNRMLFWIHIGIARLKQH